MEKHLNFCPVCVGDYERKKLDRVKGQIITLCGSTDFKKEYEIINRELTLRGKIVISVGVFRGDFNEIEKHRALLENIHKAKISIAEAIFVINKGGHIGKHTQCEIDYAKWSGKDIYYME